MSGRRSDGGWGTGSRWVIGAAALDGAMIVAFALAGRRSHDEGVTLTGVLRTSGPFLIAYAIVAILGRLDRAPLALVRSMGIAVATVALGMMIRRIVGDGTAAAFVIVAFATLGVLMVGWRVVVRGIHRMLT